MPKTVTAPKPAKKYNMHDLLQVSAIALQGLLAQGSAANAPALAVKHGKGLLDELEAQAVSQGEKPQ
jgi:hypothetical protein